MSGGIRRVITQVQLRGTVATEFFNYQTWGKKPSASGFNSCSPNLVQLLHYLRGRWNGSSLGCRNVRPIRGGSSWSSHAYGAALDWGYGEQQHNGPGRSVLLNEVLPFLINYSSQLGVQAIHDYIGQRIWRAGRGWASSRMDSGLWIHIEVHPKRWGDSRPVPQKIGPITPPPDPPPPDPNGFNPGNCRWGLYPLIGSPLAPGTSLPVLRMGQKDPTGNDPQGEFIKYAQGIMRCKAGQQIGVDGDYGQQTKEAVGNIQQLFKLFGTSPDVIEWRTWEVLNWLLNPVGNPPGQGSGAPPWDPDNCKFSLYPLIGTALAPGTALPQLRMGQQDPTGTRPQGEFISFAQGILRCKAGQHSLSVDGDYGDQTKAAVANFQQFFKLFGTRPDIIDTTQTWPMLMYVLKNN